MRGKSFDEERDHGQAEGQDMVPDDRPTKVKIPEDTRLQPITALKRYLHCPSPSDDDVLICSGYDVSQIHLITLQGDELYQVP